MLEGTHYANLFVFSRPSCAVITAAFSNIVGGSKPRCTEQILKNRPHGEEASGKERWAILLKCGASSDGHSRGWRGLKWQVFSYWRSCKYLDSWHGAFWRGKGMIKEQITLYPALLVQNNMP